MATISPINIASSTGSNWLKEAQESLAAAENPGGLLGALNDSRYPGTIKNFLAKSQNTANNMALIAQSGQQSATSLAIEMASAAAQKRAAEQLAFQQKINATPTNYNPPTTLDSFIYFEDGTSIDTVNNVLTMPDGSKIDTVTGQPYIEPGSLIQMANGAYLDTKNNILTLADGTKIDTVTGLTITA